MKKEYRVVRLDRRGIFKICNDRWEAVRSVLGLTQFYMYHEDERPMEIQSRRFGMSGNDSTWTTDPVTERERLALKSEIDARLEKIAAAKAARRQAEAAGIRIHDFVGNG